MLTTELKSCIRFNTDNEITVCISLSDDFVRAALSDLDSGITICHAELLDTVKRATSDPDLTAEQKLKIAELI
jgi:hypothetical protein